jgi:hypothetical protein
MQWAARRSRQQQGATIMETVRTHPIEKLLYTAHTHTVGGREHGPNSSSRFRSRVRDAWGPIPSSSEALSGNIDVAYTQLS